MASERHSDSDGSDIFWPGYVDAVTNLVLNLLFLLTIMTVAVFMFALELGRASQGGSGKNQVATRKKDGTVASKAAPDPVLENIELKREIQRLNLLLAERGTSTVPPVHPAQSDVPTGKTIEVSSGVQKPATGLNKALSGDLDLVVRFKDDAVAFTPAEQERLREALKPIVASGKTNITVDVPSGFSEAKRMGFYRAMAVRNLLIEMKMPKDKIKVAVHERKSNANASVVKVSSR